MLWVVFLVGDYGFIVIETSLTIDGFLAFYAGVLTFLGTVSLGVVTVWQSIKANSINTALSERQMKLFEFENKYAKLNHLKETLSKAINIIDTSIFSRVTEITFHEDWRSLKADIDYIYNKAYDESALILAKYHFLEESCKDCSACAKPCDFGEVDLDIQEKIKSFLLYYAGFAKSYTDELKILKKELQQLIRWVSFPKEQQERFSADDKTRCEYTYTTFRNFINSKNAIYERLVNDSHIELLRCMVQSKRLIEQKQNKLKQDLVTFGVEEQQNER